MNDIDAFIARCDAYRAARKPPISRARLATILFNDGAKLDSLASGTDVGSRRLAKAFADLAALESGLAANDSPSESEAA
jgi:hypothetical protein